MYVIQRALHQGVNQTAAGVFRIGGDAGDTAHIHDCVVNVDLHGVDDDHGGQFVVIEPSDHVCFLQNRTLGIFDLILFPAGLEQIVRSDLKSIL